MGLIRNLLTREQKKSGNDNPCFLYGYDEICEVLDEIRGLTKVISLYFPERVFYPQKRGFYRVFVAFLEKAIYVRSKPGIDLESKKLEARIDDIGLDGISFVMEPVVHFWKFDRTTSSKYVRD